MTIWQLVGWCGVASAASFLLGALTGNGFMTGHQRRRARRQAKAQRRINEARRDVETPTGHVDHARAGYGGAGGSSSGHG